MYYDFIIYLNAALVGTMIFFVSVITPTVFSTLSNEHSSTFLRTVFPRMFLFGFILSFISAILSIYSGHFLEFYFLTIVSILFLLNRNLITPKINFYRDREIEGDEKAKKYFKVLHLLSVILFIVNFVIIIVLLIKNSFDLI
tara:strand:- start:253 stop:678 length:426 start_codon:yes stop_codon:yes gene_type:complete